MDGFLDQLVSLGAPLERRVLGVSDRGRKIPLLLCASPMPADAAEARESGRLVIYLQANIHGGEIEGKEVTLMLLREIAAGLHPHWLANTVILCTPVYNVDGNEAWGEGLINRAHQHGPERIGERENGKGLDLNRDCMKAESPEMQGALSEIYNRWDPDLVLDLHTTNGTRHGYTLTYAPPLHPDTDTALLDFTRDQLLRPAHARMRDQWGEETNDFGNVQEHASVRGWYTFSPLGRYVSNYAGLRNRIAVLTEATSYLPLETRIKSTHRFVSTILDLASSHKQKIADLCREADRKTAQGKVQRLSTGWSFASRGEEPLHLETPDSNRAPHEPPESLASETLPVYDRFETSSSRPLPRAYWLPAGETRIIAVLQRHGIKVEPCDSETSIAVESFLITSVFQHSGLSEGHRTIELKGSWQPGEISKVTAESGYRISTRQPLARLIFHLLEPDLEDSLIAWNFATGILQKGGSAPMLRIR